ncbi:MAG: hypothetical protein KY456_16070, partial [Chloroflexi bacterium]|nr:hypothetical protein [Chloroflexota bacterium]
MYRFLALVSVAAIAGVVALGGATTRTDAQEGTPQPVAGHSIIGAWLLDVDTEDPVNPPSLAIFHDDGTYLQADSDGSNGIGVWEVTGANSATLTALFYGQDEAGEFAGAVQLRATIAIDEAGDSLTAEYTLEFIDPAGASSGEIGPGAATAERITVD